MKSFVGERPEPHAIAKLAVYLGQTHSPELMATLDKYGFGEMVCRGDRWIPPRRKPWSFDNGAYMDWSASRPFDEPAFLADCERIAGATEKPDFIVLPDRVMGGDLSLEISMDWEPKLRGLAPLYLAVQDGMNDADVRDALEDVAGLFVGGSLRWKLRTGESWVKMAAEQGKPCHLGRCGTAKRVRWARRIGVSSIDSCLPLWSTPKLYVFLHALAFDESTEPQMGLV